MLIFPPAVSFTSLWFVYVVAELFCKMAAVSNLASCLSAVLAVLLIASEELEQVTDS